jgi:Holliday junction resolvasome RuvABC endonuclease subunit
MTRVLALDLATNTGWACGSTEGTPVSHGVVTMPKTGDDLGWYLCHFRDWLNLACDDMEPEQIVFESPIMPEGTSIQTLRKLYSLCGVTELVARERKILVTEANLAQIRKHFIGTSKAPSDIKDARVRRMWLKNRTIEECCKRGFSATDDNDADAIALLSLRLSQLDASYSLRATPLFAKDAA